MKIDIPSLCFFFLFTVYSPGVLGGRLKTRLLFDVSNGLESHVLSMSIPQCYRETCYIQGMCPVCLLEENSTFNRAPERVKRSVYQEALVFHWEF